MLSHNHKRVGDETFRSQRRSVSVSATDADTADVQLTDHARWHQTQRPIQNEQIDVRHRRTDRNADGVMRSHRVERDHVRRFRRAVTVHHAYSA